MSTKKDKTTSAPSARATNAKLATYCAQYASSLVFIPLGYMLYQSGSSAEAAGRGACVGRLAGWFAALFASEGVGQILIGTHLRTSLARGDGRINYIEKKPWSQVSFIAFGVTGMSRVMISWWVLTLAGQQWSTIQTVLLVLQAFPILNIPFAIPPLTGLPFTFTAYITAYTLMTNSSLVPLAMQSGVFYSGVGQLAYALQLIPLGVSRVFPSYMLEILNIVVWSASAFPALSLIANAICH